MGSSFQSLTDKESIFGLRQRNFRDSKKRCGLRDSSQFSALPARMPDPATRTAARLTCMSSPASKSAQTSFAPNCALSVRSDIHPATTGRSSARAASGRVWTLARSSPATWTTKCAIMTSLPRLPMTSRPSATEMPATTHARMAVKYLWRAHPATPNSAPGSTTDKIPSQAKCDAPEFQKRQRKRRRNRRTAHLLRLLTPIRSAPIATTNAAYSNAKKDSTPSRQQAQNVKVPVSGSFLMALNGLRAFLKEQAG